MLITIEIRVTLYYEYTEMISFSSFSYTKHFCFSDVKNTVWAELTSGTNTKEQEARKRFIMKSFIVCTI
jgi:hypothetical protein